MIASLQMPNFLDSTFFRRSVLATVYPDDINVERDYNADHNICAQVTTRDAKGSLLSKSSMCEGEAS